ncbi:unnamed protein product [Prorocentrum cordatum]|uniref:Uncharacterized protein n=1 Tax=Prorocentrum cordatum TaxID=2364126 RepID=A0ABN9XRR1_9DINO|nr:unnamed protein product [Polarella glacialis]
MLRAEPSSPRAAGPPSVAPPPHPPRAAQGTPAAGPRHDGLRAGLWRDAAGQPAGKPGARRLPRGWPTSCWRTPVSRGAKWDQPLCGPPLARVLGRESRVGGRQKRTSARNIREQQVTADRELNPSGMARERQPSRWHHYNAAPWARSTSTGGAAGKQQVAQTLSGPPRRGQNASHVCESPMLENITMRITPRRRRIVGGAARVLRPRLLRPHLGGLGSRTSVRRVRSRLPRGTNSGGARARHARGRRGRGGGRGGGGGGEGGTERNPAR